MKRSKEEYLMLREEILRLETGVDNTISLVYAFVSALLAFAITQDEPTVVLSAYVVIIPAYKILSSMRKSTYRIAAYLYVFHEGEEFNWERRQHKLNKLPNPFTFKVLFSFSYPFLFVSTFVTIIFCSKIDWSDIGKTEEFLKVLFAFTLYCIQFLFNAKNKKINIDKFLPDWEKIKQEEDEKICN